MKSFRSHFVFSRDQRFGIITLVGVILVGLCMYFFSTEDTPSVLDLDSPTVLAYQKTIDSLKAVQLEAKKPKIYPFNPNFITDYKAYTLGMSPSQFDRLEAFRDNEKWINSVSDFKRVTGVSDSLIATISPYFKFPDWVTNPKPKTTSKYIDYSKEKPFDQKIDLNKATEEDLKKISGIGEALSKRIVTYRDQTLNGFSGDIQLYQVYGLNPNVVQRTLNLFTVKTPKQITKMNLNTASASDIATIPGISFELAKEIWEFRNLRERVNSFSELEKIESLSALKLQLIQLYLYIE